MADRWMEDREEAIQSGKFEKATRDDFQRRAKAFVGRAYCGRREWIMGRARSEDSLDYIDFEFDGDEGLEKLFSQFEALTEAAKEEIRKYFKEKE